MTGVGLLRHPPVRVPPGRCYGRADLRLAPGWQAGMPALAAASRRIGPRVVHTSPLERCRLPAAALAGLLGIPVRIDQRLVELDFGDWDGRCWDALPREALDRWAADPLGFAAPGGETGHALIARMREVRDALLGAGIAALVVSHGGPLRLLGPMLRGDDPDLLRPAPALGMLELVDIA